MPVRALAGLLRQPRALLAGLILHLSPPLLVIPAVAFPLRQTPDTDGGSGLLTAMILIMAMPVPPEPPVWTAKGDGDHRPWSGSSSPPPTHSSRFTSCHGGLFGLVTAVRGALLSNGSAQRPDIRLAVRDPSGLRALSLDLIGYVAGGERQRPPVFFEGLCPDQQRTSRSHRPPPTGSSDR
ncbi:hypothetical protein ACWC0C_47215 [Streptomyces sp. NPDC001709]